MSGSSRALSAFWWSWLSAGVDSSAGIGTFSALQGVYVQDPLSCTIQVVANVKMGFVKHKTLP